jgi:hypothetical protein
MFALQYNDMVIGKFPKERFGGSHGTALPPLPAQDHTSPFGVIGVVTRYHSTLYKPGPYDKVASHPAKLVTQKYMKRNTVDLPDQVKNQGYLYRTLMLVESVR